MKHQTEGDQSIIIDAQLLQFLAKIIIKSNFSCEEERKL